MSVISKRLSGTGFSSSNWTFNYGYNSSVKYTDAYSPDGSRTRTTFHNRDNDNLEGLEQKVEVYSASNQLLKRTSNSYIIEGELGITYQTNENPAKTVAPRLSSRSVHLLGSDIYTTSTTYNNVQTSGSYSYGKPTTVEEYNNFNSLNRVTDTTYEHKNAIWRLALPKTIEVNGVEHVNNTYDSLGRLSQVNKFGSMYAQFGYHTNNAYKGAIYWIDNANNKRTYALNWKRGTPQQIKRADSESTFRVVDNNGWITRDTDFEGNCINYRYNNIGELTLIDPCDSAWINTSISYTLTNGNEGIAGVGAGMRKQIITRGNYEQVVYYDDMQRPVAERTRDKSASNTTVYKRISYDYYNRPVFSSFPSASASYNHGTRTAYDGLGRTASIDDTTTSGSISLTYLSNNRVRRNDNKGNVETTQFAAFGSPTQELPHIVLSPENVKTTMTINSQGLIARISQGSHSGAGNVSESRVYDSSNRLCKIVRPDVGNTGFRYDNAGNMIWKAQGSSISSSTASCDYYANSADVVRYTYSDINLLKVINFNDVTPDRSFSYDKNGRIKTSNAAGSAYWDYSYNSLGALTNETMSIDGKTFSINYTFNSLGHLNTTRYPSGNLVQHYPNALGQATSISGIASQARYHANGALKAFNFNNSFSFASTQTANGLPLSYRHLRGSIKAIDHRMTYDANNNLTFLDDLKNSAYDLRMTYDGLDRLDSITDSYYGSGGLLYDTKGNIKQYALGGRTINYHYNSVNRLTSVSGGHSASYSYDGRGNVTNNSDRSFTYNADNQMVASGSFAYKYDANGKRVKEIVNNKISYSVYSKNGKIMARYQDGKDIDYYYLAGTLVGKNKGGNVTFIHSDFLGSSKVHSKSNNILIDAQDYRPFGESDNTESGLGYTGHKYDDELGLNYMQARYYDPVIGRFYSNDPVGYTPKNPVMSFNRYLYVNNNPYKYTDPNGEFLNFAIGAIVGAAVEIGTQVLTEGKVNNWTKVGAMTVAGGVSSGLSIATKGLTVGQKVLATAGNQTIETSSAATASLISDGLTGDQAGSFERAGDTALDTTAGAGKMTVRGGKTKLGALSNAIGLKAPSSNTGSKTLDAALNRGGEALQKAAEGTAASVINTELREDK